MKSDSENNAKPDMHSLLDDATHSLPEDIQHRIAHARRHALLQTQQKKTHNSPGRTVPGLWSAGFAGAAALVLVLVWPSKQAEVPALPLAMVEVEVPLDELDLMEDLEFAEWLAEQDNEVVL